MSKDQFYFHGKYFDNETEFWEYTNDWQNFTLDEQSADRQLEVLKKEIIMNIFLRGIHFTNKEFDKYLHKIFMYSMNLISSDEPDDQGLEK